MDHTPIHLCQAQGSSHHHEKVLDFPAVNLVSVLISYGLKEDEINEGHVTRRTPTNTPRSFAWDTGTSGNNMQTVPTCKKTTRVQRKKINKDPVVPHDRVGRKRANPDHRKNEFEGNIVNTKRHKGWIETTNPPLPLAAAASQPRQSP